MSNMTVRLAQQDRFSMFEDPENNEAIFPLVSYSFSLEFYQNRIGFFCKVANYPYLTFRINQL